MAIKSNKSGYGSAAVFFHWLSAAVVLALLGTGFMAASATDTAAKVSMLRIHIPLGVVVLLLTLARIAWWRLVDQRPDPVDAVPKWQNFVAGVTHSLFYVLIIGMSASGIGMLALSGSADDIFLRTAVLLPDFWDHPPRVPHGIGARALVALFMLHVAAVIYHHLFRKEDLLSRMWPSGRGMN